MQDDTSVCALSEGRCKPCDGAGRALTIDEATGYMGKIHPDWALSEDGICISRRFKFKGYAKAVGFANAVGWIAIQQGHHPDIAFGWGYCKVSFTTHELNGLSENDFICAAKVDLLVMEN